MAVKIHVAKTWQFFNLTRKILGNNYLTKLYSRGRTTVFTWGANPTHCAEIKRNPLDRLKDNFIDLHKAKKTEISVEAANILLEDIGYEAAPIKSAEPDSDSIDRECLEDDLSLAKLHNAVLKNRNLKYVRKLARESKTEIDRTITLYEKRRADYGYNGSSIIEV